MCVYVSEDYRIPCKVSNKKKIAKHELLDKRKSVPQPSYPNLFIFAGYPIAHKPSTRLKIISMIAKKKSHYAIYLLNMLMI